MLRPNSAPFSIFAPPYDRLVPVACPPASGLWRHAAPGVALVWHMGASRTPDDLDAARHRPGGMGLITVLPPAAELRGEFDVLTVVDRCRPHSVLPFHPEPDPEELTVILQRPPEALAVDVSDYLSWRGIRVDGDTRRLVRRTIELSADLRTVSGLARSLYLSRRALGRRFLSRGLPAPSHWLQFGRVLRAAIQLQSTRDSLFSVAAGLGYPDGFALSNQMKRLVGVRPSVARASLGWEWIVESWLRLEHEHGGLRHTLPGPEPEGLRRVAEGAPGDGSGRWGSDVVQVAPPAA